jgi:Cu-Zn family superoxide dismutase
MRHPGLVLLLALPLAPASAQPAMPKDYVLHDTAGTPVGVVTVRERGQRIQLRVQVRRLPRGQHGMHLHEAGLCEFPGFQSAGPHLNPNGTMRHGHKNPQGPHLGDLRNLTVGGNGRGERTVEIGGAEARAGMATFLGLGRGGLALVIHADRDDELTDPAGSSGARIACAVLAP